MAQIRHIAIQTQDEEATANFYVEGTKSTSSIAPILTTPSRVAAKPSFLSWRAS